MNKSKSILDVYQKDQYINDKEKKFVEEVKKDKQYKAFASKDKGYFLMFEHENEAQEFLYKRQNQVILGDLLGDKDIKLPYFFPFDQLNDLCKG